MHVEFDTLPDHAKVWIYQAGRRLSEEDKNRIESMLKDFTEKWTAHGAPLKSSHKIVEDQFVVIAVDEDFNTASGCSIDFSVHVMQEIGKHVLVDFFDRSKIPFLTDQGIELISSKDLSQKYEEGVWNSHTCTFNTLANSLGLFRNEWIIPAEKTWLKRYIKAKPTHVSL